MEMKIKTWVIDREQKTARQYDAYIDYTRRTEDIAKTPLIEDGCYYVRINEILQETEKAIKVNLSTGAVVGSYKGWKCWIPKSQIC